MSVETISEADLSGLNSHLLKARLKRVSVQNLERFYSELGLAKDAVKTKENLAQEIVSYYEVMKNNEDFKIKLGTFIRDYVLSAGESEYILELDDGQKATFLQWIDDWDNGIFIGRRFDFYKHAGFELGRKILSLDPREKGKGSVTEVSDHDNQSRIIELSFPSHALLMVAYGKEKKSVFSKDKLVDFYETYEFEVIFREDTNLVGVRGNHRIVRDFMASISEESSNPIGKLSSLFLGDYDASKSRPIAKPRTAVNIDKLKKVLDGTYLDIDAPTEGDQAQRIKLSFKGMKDICEETHPLLAPVVKEAVESQEKSRIGFSYNGKDYTFSVTSNGGLYFRQVVPEEVVTYVLLKIQSI